MIPNSYVAVLLYATYVLLECCCRSASVAFACRHASRKGVQNLVEPLSRFSDRC